MNLPIRPADPSNVSAEVARLWEQARQIFYEEIGHKKAEKIADRTTLTDTIQDLKKAQNRVAKEYGDHEIKIRGKSIDWNITRIMQRLQLLLQVGDEAMNFAPESLSLVWAGFRMIFQGFMVDQETCQLLVEAVDQVSDIMFFCEVYARQYTESNSVASAASSAAGKVLECIPSIYAAILRFSYEARQLVRSNNKFKRTWKSLFGKNQVLTDIIEDANNKRENLQQTANVAFQEAAFNVFRDLQEGSGMVHALFDAVVPALENMEAGLTRDREQRSRKERKQLIEDQIKWLERGDIIDRAHPERQYTANIEKRHKATTRWIFDTFEYKDWHDFESSNLLWLSGDGGFGKSVIMSSIIERLLKEILEAQDPKPILLYFYCSSGNDATQKSQKVFLHLVMQLLIKLQGGEKQDSKAADDSKIQEEKCIELVKRSKSKMPTESASLAKVDQILEPLLASLIGVLDRTVYIVVDALDECIDRADGLVESLTSLARSQPKVRIAVSSRPEDDIEEMLLYDTAQVRVDALRTEEDVKRYVIDCLRTVGGFDKSQKAKAGARIAKKSEGRFRCEAVSFVSGISS